MNILLRIVILALFLSIFGCTGTKVRREKPADVIYNEATALFERKNYEDAIAAFQELNAKYPLSQYSVKAKLKIADAYFNEENYPEAISAYREFEKLHPTNENIPYVIFQIGMSYFNQMLSIDRDQTPSMNAAAEFARLLSGFPDSRYTDKAKKNLTAARNSLAENEFYIGNFYFRKGNFKAAIERFEAVLVRYPDFQGMDKVLFYAGKAYIEANEKDKGHALFKTLMDRYPDSKFTGDAKRIVGINTAQ